MSTLSLSLPTPTLEAALITLPPDRGRRNQTQRYVAAVAVLATGLEEQHIWNVDYEDARQEIRRAVEAALDPLIQPIYAAIRAHDKENYTDRFGKHHDDIGDYFTLTAAKGRVTRLRKQASDLIEQVPTLGLYCRILDEVVTLSDAMVALKPLVEKGRKPLENPTPVDLSNTGICAICSNRQKMNGGKKMVHHGYRISDGFGHYFGQRMGKCFGVGYKPIELSCDANIDFRKYLVNHLAEVTEALRRHRAGEVKQLDRKEWVKEPGVGMVERLKIYHTGEDGFADLLLQKIHEVERKKLWIEHEIKRQTILIDTWLPTPLYSKEPQ